MKRFLIDTVITTNSSDQTLSPLNAGIAIDSYRQDFNHLLLQQLQTHPNSSPHTLAKAIQYVCQSGKRIRPLLIYLSGQFLQIPMAKLHMAAIAVELIHSYSLVHDDLPPMDNDDLRRGMPACHVKFGEATAILAGDAMQSLAFELLTKSPELPAEVKLKMVACLAHASGLEGMAGGQAYDLYAENKEITLDELQTIHCQKTQSLLLCCVELAILAAKFCSSEKERALMKYAKNIGLAFQVHDDTLDVEMNSDILGKPQGSDANKKKSTYCTLLGLEKAKQYAQELHCEAIEALKPWPDQAEPLISFAGYLLKRKH